MLHDVLLRTIFVHTEAKPRFLGGVRIRQPAPRLGTSQLHAALAVDPARQAEPLATRTRVHVHVHHARQVDDGRNRVQALLGWDARVVRRGRIEAAMRECECVREQSEDRRQHEVEDALGEDTPDEDDQDACGASVNTAASYQT